MTQFEIFNLLDEDLIKKGRERRGSSASFLVTKGGAMGIFYLERVIQIDRDLSLCSFSNFLLLPWQNDAPVIKTRALPATWNIVIFLF